MIGMDLWAGAINAPQNPRRPLGLRGGGARGQLHESRSETRGVAVGPEPHDPRARRAARAAAPDAADAQRRPDRGRRALLRTVGPRFDEIEGELAALSELREKPAGTIRITATENAADSL